MVASKLLLRPHSLPLTIFSSGSPLYKYQLSKPTTLTVFSTTKPTSTIAQHQHFSYGPSLHKGAKPSPQLQSQNSSQFQEEEERQLSGEVINEDLFSRVYDISALRVPAEDCFALENRLRGHLLNWPRVRNVARVPGDDIEDQFKKLIGGHGNHTDEGDVEEGKSESLERRIYGKADGDGEPLSPVLYRDKLVKTFNSSGFVKFRNLAKISRPRKKKKIKEEEKNEKIKGKKGIGKGDMVLVEVIEDDEVEGEDLRGLLGDDFKGRRWRISTRLLLLDERYANKDLNELPQAIKALLKSKMGNTASTIELVRCKLTLFYNYWQMNEILEALLPKDVTVPSAFETVGHIAHLNLRDEHLLFKKIIAKVVLDKNKPKIQTVVNKMDAIHNDYRTMQLEVLAGNSSLVTTVVENGMRFHVDLSTVYWNSRLATERQRLLSCFRHNDVVCDVFAGVGPIAISSAKKVKYVYANDLNPHAVDYLARNSVLNKLERKIEVFNMDGRRFIDYIFTSQKSRTITQVVMNLPNDAAEYLDAFKGLFRRKSKDKVSTLPMIHVYGFSKARDPEFDFHERIRIGLSEVAVDVELRRVRLVAPGKWMLCASFVLPDNVAFSKRTLHM